MKTRFGEFTLDSTTRQLFRDGQEVHVSPKAFDLLSTLLERRPAVVTKQELFGRIWAGTFVGEANLNVLIGEVRRAIADEARAPRFIRTVHGVGYAFFGAATELEPDDRPSAHTARFWLERNDRRYPLGTGDHIIGRDPACAVCLNDASVSRRHARIRISADARAALLDDLESTNGTYIGRRRVEEEPMRLVDGNVIKVGSVELTFREAADALAPTRRVRRSTRDRAGR